MDRTFLKQDNVYRGKLRVVQKRKAKGRKGGRAISRQFIIARRAARLLTAWLRYRSYVVVGLQRSMYSYHTLMPMF
jgi:hypothetical protein